MKLVGSFLLLGVLLFPSCSQEPESPLRLGLLVWPPYEYFILAEDLEYYKDSKIEIVDYRTVSEAIRAYENGYVDIIAVTNQIFFKLYQSNQYNRIISIINYSKGGDVCLAGKGIDDVEELKGKKIGVEANELGAYLLYRMLELNEVSFNDINFIPIDLANHTKAFENYDIDAIITQEPFRTELIKKGYHEIFTSKSIPYEITDFLVTRESVIKEKKDQLIQLVNGFFKARRYKNKKSAKALKILSGRTGLTTGEFNNSLSLIKILTKYDNEQKLINNREAFVQKQRKVAARMERYGLLNNIRFNEPLIDTTIINQVTKK